jgi:FlaA1/EpsC-like NDP-sugar epimerase
VLKAKPEGRSVLLIYRAMWLLQSMGQRLLGLLDRLQRAFHRSPPAFRRGAAMLVDAIIVIESFAVALLFRFNGQVPVEFWRLFWPFAVFSAIAFVLLLNGNGVYQSILRYTGIYQGVRVLSATAMAAGGLFIAVFAIGPGGLRIMEEVNPVPLSVPLIGSVLAYVQLVAVRLYPRVFYEMSLREVGRRTRTAIVGTGEPGVALAGHIWRTAAGEA